MTAFGANFEVVELEKRERGKKREKKNYWRSGLEDFIHDENWWLIFTVNESSETQSHLKISNQTARLGWRLLLLHIVFVWWDSPHALLIKILGGFFGTHYVCTDLGLIDCGRFCFSRKESRPTAVGRSKVSRNGRLIPFCWMVAGQNICHAITSERILLEPAFTFGFVSVFGFSSTGGVVPTNDPLSIADSFVVFVDILLCVVQSWWKTFQFLSDGSNKSFCVSTCTFWFIHKKCLPPWWTFFPYKRQVQVKGGTRFPYGFVIFPIHSTRMPSFASRFPYSSRPVSHHPYHDFRIRFHPFPVIRILDWTHIPCCGFRNP